MGRGGRRRIPRRCVGARGRDGAARRLGGVPVAAAAVAAVDHARGAAHARGARRAHARPVRGRCPRRRSVRPGGSSGGRRLPGARAAARAARCLRGRTRPRRRSERTSRSAGRRGRARGGLSAIGALAQRLALRLVGRERPREPARGVRAPADGTASGCSRSSLPHERPRTPKTLASGARRSRSMDDTAATIQRLRVVVSGEAIAGDAGGRRAVADSAVRRSAARRSTRARASAPGSATPRSGTRRSVVLSSTGQRLVWSDGRLARRGTRGAMRTAARGAASSAAGWCRPRSSRGCSTGSSS